MDYVRCYKCYDIICKEMAYCMEGFDCNEYYLCPACCRKGLFKMCLNCNIRHALESIICTNCHVNLASE